MTEHAEQVALFAWAELMESQYPELRWMYHPANGGHRHIAVAVKMKAEGVKAGILDVCLPVARGAYHGLYIEMKFGRNTPTKEQKECIDFLCAQGYYVDVCYSAERAIEVIKGYLMLGAVGAKMT